MKSSSKISLVIVNYNSEQYISGLLNSIRKTKYTNYETIFVDNNSHDNSVKLVRKKFPEVKVIANKLNNGFSGGVNDGIKESKGEYVVIMNTDMLVHPTWLTHLIDTMNSDKKIGVVGYARLFAGTDKIEMLGHKEINKNLGKFNKIATGSNIKEFIKKEPFEVDFCLGMIRKSVLNKIGLFDEKTFAMYEEVDFCRRVKDAGYKILVNPKAKVWHFVSQSLKKTSSFRIYYAYKNRLRYVLKHNKGVSKIYHLLILSLIYLGKSLGFFFKGKFEASLVILKAMSWNIKNWKDYF
ncbi:MAG: glycosyltransferase family 2 protein [Nanoarchaeota archaeon]